MTAPQPTPAPAQPQTRIEWTGRIEVHHPRKPKETK